MSLRDCFGGALLASLSVLPTFQAQADPIIEHPHGAYTINGKKRLPVDCGEYTRYLDDSIYVSCEAGRQADPNNEKKCTDDPDLTNVSDADKRKSLESSLKEYTIHLARVHGECVPSYTANINSNLRNIPPHYRDNTQCVFTEVLKGCMDAGFQIPRR
ncbi:MAG TPA: hypothetical protein PK513_00620 [Alphaproteobacteria bacterium]|mgnify:CR=1 FL=1|nr:hypothetical protein [Alphaproteobacteria bacterium]USO05239.1 MAG: hypothetical protein H6859_08795 [Rhodospirillales bacterium]HOO80991.1 hypothetical protein [Alphaproteobacteria bacterium]